MCHCWEVSGKPNHGMTQDLEANSGRQNCLEAANGCSSNGITSHRVQTSRAFCPYSTVDHSGLYWVLKKHKDAGEGVCNRDMCLLVSVSVPHASYLYTREIRDSINFVLSVQSPDYLENGRACVDYVTILRNRKYFFFTNCPPSTRPKRHS